MQPSKTLLAMSLALATGLAHAAPEAPRGPAVLERFVGDWEVQVEVVRPAKVFTRYFESAVLAPGGKLLRSSSSVKADRTQDWSMVAFDEASGGYSLSLFSSTGAASHLGPARWDEATRSIAWKTAAGSPVSRQMRCVFSDERTRRCETLVRDRKGVVILQQSETAIRR